MCMRESEEGCILSNQLETLKQDVASLDRRMTTQEEAVKKIRAETLAGFRQSADAMREINASVTNLAHDFGERMNNLDKRILVEKEKWGETLRKILVWGAKALILGALVAMGVNIVNGVIKSLPPGGGGVIVSGDEIHPKRGRPFRRVENGFEDMPERGNGRRCGECPKWGQNEICSIRAERRARNAICCRYGHVLIGAMRQEFRRKAAN